MALLSPQISASEPSGGGSHRGGGNPVAPPGTEPTLAKVKNERDRYVALAFAAGDVLLEIGFDRIIKMASGACQSLCGRSADDILNKDVRDLADPRDRAFLNRILDCLTVMRRLDPVPIRLAHSSGAKPRVLVGACHLPTFPDRIFMSMTLIPAGGDVDEPRDAQTGLLTKDGILKAAQSSVADPSGPVRQLSLIRLTGLIPASRTLSQDRADTLMQEIGVVIRAASFGGDAAGRIGAEEFGFIRSGAASIDDLPQVFGKVAAESGLAANAFKTEIANLDLSVGQLNEAEAARALAYAFKCFSDAKGEAFTLSSLADGLPATMERTVERFGSLSRLIENGDLQLVFQPIVAIKTRSVHHYEVLSRFPDGGSPYDTITFSEEVGLIEDLDLAVLKKAVAQIIGPTGPKIAVNMSGRSIQSDRFRSAVEAVVRSRKSVAARVMFELTESNVVEQVDEAATFLQWLRAQGHKVCLDDFGAGAAAYNYLRHFDVDFVKIDGPFLRAALDRPRERALISSICRLCSDLGSATIGEMIETEDQAASAAALGIDFGQGWLYGKPTEILPGGPPIGPGWRPSKKTVN